MVVPKEPIDQRIDYPSILLASDLERVGSSLHQALRKEGFEVHFAGDYSGLDAHLDRQAFDMVLLEVTGEYAVESAVATALRVKRARTGQLVGYIADTSLDARGLAGDGIFPRSAARLSQALRSFLADTASGVGMSADSDSGHSAEKP
jgi:PleD family two-component response regulator